MNDDQTATRVSRDDEARKVFAYLAAHALDSVVHRLVGPLVRLRLTASEQPLSAEQMALLDLADAASSQLMRLCDDVAILTLAASHDLDTAPERLPLTTLVREAIAQARTPERSQVDRTITQRLSHALPTLWCDPTLTRRALAALIENALRFSPSDAPIAIETHKRGGWAMIRVRDRGAGVPPDVAQTIFDPFRPGQRRRNDSGVGMGIGLGLAVARACVEAQGGRLALEPASETGAIFSIELPITQPDDAKGDSR